MDARARRERRPAAGGGEVRDGGHIWNDGAPGLSRLNPPFATATGKRPEELKARKMGIGEQIAWLLQEGPDGRRHGPLLGSA